MLGKIERWHSDTSYFTEKYLLNKLLKENKYKYLQDNIDEPSIQDQDKSKNKNNK